MVPLPAPRQAPRQAPQPAPVGAGQPAVPPVPPARAAGGGRRAAHVADTRHALLRAARELFSTRGYQHTGTEDIVQRAGLTRGALYHHFQDKADLFRAVFDEVEAEVARSLRRRGTALAANERPRGGSESGSGSESGAAMGSTQRPAVPDPWELYRVNNAIYLDAASSNPAYRQIVLIDAPAVFGWDHWPARRQSEGVTRQITRYVEDSINAGALASQPVQPLVELLEALGSRAVVLIAHSSDPTGARREIGDTVNRILDGLRVDTTKPTGAPSVAATIQGGGR